MTLTVITPPVEEPVSIDEAKAYLRLDGADQDALISSEISAARQFCERYTGLLLVTQTVAARLDGWPSSERSDWWTGVKDGAIDDLCPAVSAVPLPVGPAQNLIGIDLIDEENASTPVTPVPAYVTTGLLPLLVLKSGQRWPKPLRKSDGISVMLTVGFGGASQVPFALREGILQLVAHRFDHPTTSDLPEGVKTLWSSYRRIGL